MVTAFLVSGNGRPRSCYGRAWGGFIEKVTLMRWLFYVVACAVNLLRSSIKKPFISEGLIL